METRRLSRCKVSSLTLMIWIACTLTWQLGCNLPPSQSVKKSKYNASDLLYSGCVRGDLDLVIRELENGANPNGVPKSIPEIPIVGASREGRLEVVKILLKHGANPYLGDLGGATALHMAAWKGHLRVVEFFVSEGLNVDVCDKDNSTPLMFAVSEGNRRVVEWLIKKGANPEKVTLQGFKSIHWAAYRGQTQMVELLNDCGVNINAQDGEGRTPLVLSMISSHKDTAKLLLSLGANAEIGDNYGRTAVDWAKLLEMGDLLKE